MRVYLETNFLLEIAFAQEEAGACEALLDLAEAGEVELAIPVFCLVEAAETRRRRSAEVRSFSEQYKRPDHLTRLPWLDGAVRNFRQDVLTHLSLSGQRLAVLRSRIEAANSVLPLDGAIALQSDTLCDELTLHPPDGVVLATILSDASRRQSDSIFLNRNTSDFDTGPIRGRLAAVRCRLVNSFQGGLALIRPFKAPASGA